MTLHGKFIFNKKKIYKNFAKIGRFLGNFGKFCRDKRILNKILTNFYAVNVEEMRTLKEIFKKI